MLALCAGVQAGPFAPAAGQAGSTAVHMDTNALAAWATGWTDYVVGSNCAAQWQTPHLALGKAVGTSYDIVSLGEKGRITLTFDTPIRDGPGPDFAVFENAFSDAFLELAYVAVSSDGTNFYRFPSDSLTPSPVGPYGTLDPTDVRGLGCKYRQGYGEPYDLADLAGSATHLDAQSVRWVRILDVSGDGTCTDSFGRVIYDPYPATNSAGFDLDAIGVLSNAFEEVVIEAGRNAGELGPTNGFFTVTRKTWNPASDLTVYLCLTGTAVNGADYHSISNPVVIPAGARTRTIEVVPVPDAAPEGDETIRLQVCTNDAYVVGAGGGATVVLADLPFDDWRVRYFGEDADSPRAEEQADWDEDGTGNLLEYALDRNPTNRDARAGLEPCLVSSNGATFFAVSYERRRNLPDAELAVEARHDLLEGEWTGGPAAVAETVLWQDEERMRVRALIRGSDGEDHTFARLKAWRP